MTYYLIQVKAAAAAAAEVVTQQSLVENQFSSILKTTNQTNRDFSTNTTTISAITATTTSNANKLANAPTSSHSNYDFTEANLK